MDETELIAAARSGDEEALQELYQQHVGYVKAVGRAILRKNDLDDMCQDTFLLAFSGCIALKVRAVSYLDYSYRDEPVPSDSTQGAPGE